MYEMMFYAGAILAGIGFILTLVFFVKDNVAKILGDVTGWNAKKEIKKMNQKGAQVVSKNEILRAQSEEIVVKDMEPSGEITVSGGEIDEEETVLLVEEETTLLAEEKTMLLTGEETEILMDEETTLLASQTEILDGEETTVLHANEESFTGEGEYTVGEELPMPSIFEVEEDSIVVHTNDNIQE